MSDLTLAEIVASLTDRIRDHLVSIRVELIGADVTARLSISLFGPVDEEARVVYAQQGNQDRHALSVDTDAMPEGVAVTAFVRWPDVVRPLSMTPDITTQIQVLHESQLAGTIVATQSRVRADDTAKARAAGVPILAWSILTHDERARRRSSQQIMDGWHRRPPKKPRRGARGRPWSIVAAYPGRCTETGRLYKAGSRITPHPRGGWMLVEEPSE